jgi:hypothetical protein
MVGKSLSAVALGTLWILFGSTASAGEFSYTGLLRSETAFSTTRERTQPADRGTPYDNQGRVLNLGALRLELEGKYTINEQLAATGKLRSWGDSTNQLDGHYKRNADLFAGDEFPGNGWLLGTTGLKDGSIDVPELYLDWTLGNLWLRMGKQQNAWGHAIGMRILDDMISSLDIRRHGGNYDLAAEEFLDERIGQLGMRGNFRIPGSDWELETVITDFTPTFIFPRGSAYANVPGSVRLLNAEGVRKARGNPAYGLRLKGLVLDGQGDFTLAYTYRPQAIGVVQFDPAKDLGVLLNQGELTLRAQNPRISVVGGAFSYSISTDPVGSFSFVDGLIARIEAAYYFNKKFTNSAAVAVGGLPPIPFAGKPIKKDELSLGIVLEKSHKFHPDWLATLMIFEWWHRTKSDLNDRLQSLVGLRYWDWFLLSVTQNFMRNEIGVTLNTFYDTSGGWFLQPAFKWRPNDKYQVDLFYNWFDGGQKSVYGPLRPNKEFVMRLGFYF